MKKRRKKKKPKGYGLVFGHRPRPMIKNLLTFVMSDIADRYIELREKEQRAKETPCSPSSSSS